MNRRKLREQVFLLLFQIDFLPKDDMNGQVDIYIDELADSMSSQQQLLIASRFKNISARIEEIDRLINEKTSGWTTDRMGKVELTVLRLSVFEIMYDDNVPSAVAINEAVELSKKYGQEESASFVNGVLAHFV